MRRALMIIGLAVASATLTLPAVGQAAVKDEMRAMLSSFRGISNATDAATIKAGLEGMKEHASRAKADPEFNNGPDSHVFNEGLTILLAQIDDAIALVDAGKLEEAKSAAQNLLKTRAEYHKKLGV